MKEHGVIASIRRSYAMVQTRRPTRLPRRVLNVTTRRRCGNFLMERDGRNDLLGNGDTWTSVFKDYVKASHTMKKFRGENGPSAKHDHTA